MGNEQSCAPCNSGWTPHSIQGTTHCLKHIGDGWHMNKRSGTFARTNHLLGGTFGERTTQNALANQERGKHFRSKVKF